jgi:hypothetical protein
MKQKPASTPSASKPSERGNALPGDNGGLALSCLLGAFVGCLFTSPHLDFERSQVLFFCYVIVAGLLLQRRGTDRFWLVFLRSFPSAVFLVFSSAVIHGIIWAAKGMGRTVLYDSGSVSLGFHIEVPGDLDFLIILLILGLVLSWILITISTLSSGILTRGIIRIYDFGPARLKRVNQLVKIGTGVVGSVATGVALAYSYLK